jgi:hypothetical protein
MFGRRMNVRRRRPITVAVTALSVVSLVCLIGCYLALHDIYRDYASPKVLLEHVGLTQAPLPEWTECPLEWRVIRVGFWPMLAFHILFVVSLAWQGGDNTRDLATNTHGTTS